MQLIKWTATRYERATATAAWCEVEDDRETQLATPLWADYLTGEGLGVWRKMGGVRVKRNERGDVCEIARTRPDKLAKTIETFEPVRIPWGDMGYRERAILNDLAPRMCGDRVDTTPGHDVYRIYSADGSSFEFDFATGQVTG